LLYNNIFLKEKIKKKTLILLLGNCQGGASVRDARVYWGFLIDLIFLNTLSQSIDAYFFKEKLARINY